MRFFPRLWNWDAWWLPFFSIRGLFCCCLFKQKILSFECHNDHERTLLSLTVSTYAYLSCAFFFSPIITHCCFSVLNNTSLFNMKLMLLQTLVLTLVSTLTPMGANQLRTDGDLFPSLCPPCSPKKMILDVKAHIIYWAFDQVSCWYCGADMLKFSLFIYLFFLFSDIFGFLLHSFAKKPLSFRWFHPFHDHLENKLLHVFPDLSKLSMFIPRLSCKPLILWTELSLLFAYSVKHCRSSLQSMCTS